MLGLKAFFKVKWHAMTDNNETTQKYQSLKLFLNFLSCTEKNINISE